MSTYIIKHHGVKGMKWGVRHYQNTDGSLTPAGRIHYGVNTEKTRKFLERDTEARKKIDKKYKEYESYVNSLASEKPKNDEWWDSNRNLTDKAKKYLNKVDKKYDEARDYETKMWDEDKKEIDQLIKDVFFNDDVKDDVKNAREVYKKLDNVRKTTLDESSEYAKKGYEAYKKQHAGEEGDLEYGFYHYQWREGSGNEYYKQAEAEYKKQTKELSDKYDQMTKDIGRKVCGDLADVKISKYSTYAEQGEFEVNQIIMFKDEYFK